VAQPPSAVFLVIRTPTQSPTFFAASGIAS